MARDSGGGRQRGLGLGELLLITATASLAVAAATAQLLPDSQTRPSVRGAAQTVGAYLQLARVEAVSRDHPCLLRLEPDRGRLVVLDTRGTATPADDEALHGGSLPDGVRFAALEGGTEVEFRPDGSASPAAITLSDGRSRARVTVDRAAAIRNDVR